MSYETYPYIDNNTISNKEYLNQIGKLWYGSSYVKVEFLNFINSLADNVDERKDILNHNSMLCFSYKKTEADSNMIDLIDSKKLNNFIDKLNLKIELEQVLPKNKQNNIEEKITKI